MRIIVFAKQPQAGRVKTRLIPALGAAAAAELHRRLLERTLIAARHAAPGAVELHGTPDIAGPFFADCAVRHGAKLVAQSGGDLGERMAAAIGDVCERGPAVLIGCDCPALDVTHLRAAMNALTTGHDAVLGPVDDGGYALIGFARFDVHVFERIEWSTSRVMEQTRARMRSAGLHWHELPMLWDVDRPADLARLRHDFPALIESLDVELATRG